MFVSVTVTWRWAPRRYTAIRTFAGRQSITGFCKAGKSCRRFHFLLPGAARGRERAGDKQSCWNSWRFHHTPSSARSSIQPHPHPSLEREEEGLWWLLIAGTFWRHHKLPYVAIAPLSSWRVALCTSRDSLDITWEWFTWSSIWLDLNCGKCPVSDWVLKGWTPLQPSMSLTKSTYVLGSCVRGRPSYAMLSCLLATGACLGSWTWTSREDLLH